MFKKLVRYAFLLGFTSASYADVTYDGHLDLDEFGNQTEYDVFFDITYIFDGRTIEGGKVGLGSDLNNDHQYMYIQHPLGFKDLSYGAASDQRFRVGWDGQNDGNISLENAVGSEHFTISFNGGNNIEFNLGKTINSNSTTSSNDTTGFLSTLDYNRSQVALMRAANGLSAITTLGRFESSSPKTQTGGDCSGETSSDPSCYILATGGRNRFNTNGVGPVIDWDFNFGIEIELSKDLFDLSNVNKDSFGYKDSDALINLVALHASDPKTTSTNKHGEANCTSGLTTDHHETCDITVTTHTPNPVPVPEPSSLLIFGLGLVGLGLKRRKIKSA